MVYVLNYLRVLSIQATEVMKYSRVYSVGSPDGEIHLSIEEKQV